MNISTRILSAGGGPPQGPDNDRVLRNAAWVVGHGTAWERWRHWCPYGMWTCADGRRVLFNRAYLPIYERRPDALGRIADHREWVADIVATEYFHTADRINSLLVEWALPQARPRPRQASSSPARRWRLERADRLEAALAKEPWLIPFAFSRRELCDRYNIKGKKRDYLLRGKPRKELRGVPEEDRWKVLDRKAMWLAYCLHEDAVPIGVAFMLLRESRWNRHKGEWGDDKVRRTLAIAYRKPRPHPHGKGPAKRPLHREGGREQQRCEQQQRRKS